MPIHDWTRVEDGISHDFHHAWMVPLEAIYQSAWDAVPRRWRDVVDPNSCVDKLGATLLRRRQFSIGRW